MQSQRDDLAVADEALDRTGLIRVLSEALQEAAEDLELSQAQASRKSSSSGRRYLRCGVRTAGGSPHFKIA